MLTVCLRHKHVPLETVKQIQQKKKGESSSSHRYMMRRISKIGAFLITPDYRIRLNSCAQRDKSSKRSGGLRSLLKHFPLMGIWSSVWRPGSKCSYFHEDGEIAGFRRTQCARPLLSHTVDAIICTHITHVANFQTMLKTVLLFWKGSLRQHLWPSDLWLQTLQNDGRSLYLYGFLTVWVPRCCLQLYLNSCGEQWQQ